MAAPLCASAAFCGFSVSEATSIKIQANLLKPLINQHQLSKTNSKDLSVGLSWGRFRGSRGVGLSWGAIRAFVGNDSGGFSLSEATSIEMRELTWAPRCAGEP